MRGRKPKPTKLKLVTGNPGKRSLNDREPNPTSSLPSCPAHLDAAAKKEWRRVVSELGLLGILTALDMAALACYCQAWSRVVKLEALVQKEGESLLAGNEEGGGRYYTNPNLTALNNALKTLHQYASEIGLTPSSRARLQISPPSQQDDFEQLLNATPN